MTEKNFTLSSGNKYERISKVKARKLFNNGMNVLIMRNNVNPNYFVPLYNVIGLGCGNKDFDKAVNAYEYYNHETELGNRTEFYVRVNA